jgi:hypothetical protein
MFECKRERVREDLEAVYYANLEGEGQYREPGWYLVKCTDIFVSGPWNSLTEAKSAMKYIPNGVMLRG